MYIAIKKSYFRWWMMYRTFGKAPYFVEVILNTISLRLGSYSVICLTWAFALSLALPPLLGWSYYVPEPNGIRHGFII